MKGLFSESMTFKEMKIVGDTVKVHFDNTYGAYNRFEGIKVSKLQAKIRCSIRLQPSTSGRKATILE